MGNMVENGDGKQRSSAVGRGGLKGRGRMEAEAEERAMASCHHADCKRRREFKDLVAGTVGALNYSPRQYSLTAPSSKKRLLMVSSAI